MPAYSCGTEIDPFVYYGLNIIFYRVNQQAQIDLDDLLHRVTARTRVIYVTHYFGWPQDIEFISDYCRDKNIYLIEDCALSLFSKPVDHPIGVLGNAAIYSFPKTLPVPDGGALTIPFNVPATEFPTESPPLGLIFKKMLPLIKRSVLRLSDKVGLYQYLPQHITRSRTRDKRLATPPAGLPEMPQSYYFNKDYEEKNASIVTRYILEHSCQDFIVKQRRKNYLKLYKAVQATSLLQPVFGQLPDGICPLHFPVLVKDREPVCSYLNEKGVAAVKWWAGYHRAFSWSEFHEARYLKDHVITIPIHQQLSSDDMEYICFVISSIGNL
jgi:dTDP-4-amino-4,6-dideoxygalactose transaminase